MTNIYFYIGFAVLIIGMLLMDLGLFNKKSHKVTNKEALAWTGVWTGLALIFGLLIYFFYPDESGHKATEFFTAYIIEKALSVDNLFVFILVFSFFKVPDEYHHKVLTYGIVGAIVLRCIFIFSGATIINYTNIDLNFDILSYHIDKINWVLALFGAFLVYAGIGSLKDDDDEEKDFSNNPGVKIIKWFYNVVPRFDGDKFFTKENGVKSATLLLVVVGVVEVTDLIFAVDSIPAIFTISRDPFILYTSNIFAILGLRMLYFLLSNFMQYFSYLKYGLAFVLSFIGIKMLIEPVYHISSPVSLGIVAGALLTATLASIIFKPKEA
jgi:tellurite resistance protein TerC